jgi:hypothetical protein
MKKKAALLGNFYVLTNLTFHTYGMHNTEKGENANERQSYGIKPEYKSLPEKFCGR